MVTHINTITRFEIKRKVKGGKSNYYLPQLYGLDVAPLSAKNGKTGC